MFLILILAGMFMFVSIFIDYARIAAFKVQAERMTHAAMRSVMSAYDTSLREYGLFGYGDSSGEAIMAKVLNDSVKPSAVKDGFPILDIQWDTTSLSMERELGRYDIFNRQIQEDMKYRAPVDFTLEVVNRFKPMSEEMKEAAHTVDLLKKLQKLYDKREELLDEAIANQTESADKLKGLPALIMNPPSSTIYDEMLRETPETAAEVAARYTDYLNKKQMDEGLPFNQQQYMLELARYRTGVGNVATGISMIIQPALQAHQTKLEEAQAKIEEARQINEEMKRVIAEGENRSQNASYEKVGNSTLPGTSPPSTGSGSEAKSTRSLASELVRADTLFDQLNARVRSQNSDFTNVRNDSLELNTQLRSVTVMSGVSIKPAVRQASQVTERYMDTYVKSGPSNVVLQSKQLLESGRGSDAQRKANDTESKGKLKEVKRILSQIEKGSSGSMEAFKQLEEYYNANIAFNQASREEAQKAEIAGDPYDSGGDAMNGMDSLFSGMSNLLDSLGDELFQNEYALAYFNSMDFGQLLSWTESSGDAGEVFKLENQELEYIIYGFHNPSGNIAAAYAEIFGMRLAIRTAEGLIENSKLGNPLLVLSAAILYGITNAIADMVKLAKDGSVELSKYIKVKLTYRDHLRLFLLMHSNNERKMSRMLALIRLNTGVNPDEKQTYASGNMRSSIKLWFLPGVTRSIGAVMGSADQVEDGRFFIDRKADYSY
ncbi:MULTISPECIES: hypothetical protein [Paenibacillus]|uniref:Uncharacterized protein n=1 Tax=Paenibacillus pabuli TaxID=1472 RepID=A0A855YKD5_9BACL|nr:MULTISPECIES: hypothetical protein [Paenibacillus]PWW45344.1 hypothetical protein DET56_101552 [Paenibacillus pabuli]PXW11681.1 hypothetical protein DEU73_101551 [Paenibacillus taichungensis]